MIFSTSGYIGTRRRHHLILNIVTAPRTFTPPIADQADNSKCVKWLIGSRDDATTTGEDEHHPHAPEPRTDARSRLELLAPCGKNKNLITCTDFSEMEKRHLFEIPRFPGEWAASDKCPRCTLHHYDKRRLRMVEATLYGWRVGCGASRTRPGVDLYCCAVM